MINTASLKKIKFIIFYEVLDLLNSHEVMEDDMMSSLDTPDLDGESVDEHSAEGMALLVMDQRCFYLLNT